MKSQSLWDLKRSNPPMLEDLAFKVVFNSGACIYGRGVWKLPLLNGKPGKWRVVKVTEDNPLKLCSHGLHFCDWKHIRTWYNGFHTRLFLAEVVGERLYEPFTPFGGSDKFAVAKGRLVKELFNFHDLLFMSNVHDRSLSKDREREIVVKWLQHQGVEVQ